MQIEQVYVHHTSPCICTHTTLTYVYTHSSKQQYLSHTLAFSRPACTHTFLTHTHSNYMYSLRTCTSTADARTHCHTLSCTHTLHTHSYCTHTSHPTHSLLKNGSHWLEQIEVDVGVHASEVVEQEVAPRVCAVDLKHVTQPEVTRKHAIQAKAGLKHGMRPEVSLESRDLTGSDSQTRNSQRKCVPPDNENVNE